MRKQQQTELVCIDLTEEVESSCLKRSARLTSQRRPSEARARRSTRRRDEDSDDDDDVVVVKTVASKGKRDRSGSESQGRNAKRSKYDEHTLGEEEDLAIVGTAGQDILRDLPHQRPDCAEHRFSSGACCKPNAQHCAQCYCFVCDVKASECCAWGSGTSGRDHCNAFKTDEWKQQRNLARQHGRPKGPAGAARPSPPQAARAWPSHRLPHPAQAQPPPRSFRDPPAAGREAPAARERRAPADACDAMAAAVSAFAAAAQQHLAAPPHSAAAGRYSSGSSYTTLYSSASGGARPQQHRPPHQASADRTW